MKKRFLAIITSIVILSSFSVYAADIPMAVAEEANISTMSTEAGFYEDITVESEPFPLQAEVSIEYSDGADTEGEPGFVDELHDIYQLRADSVPTIFHDLSEEPYYASFGRKVTETYTNRYFNTNSDGEIRIDLSDASSGYDYFKIICYLTNGDEVASWSGDPTDKIVKFYNLNDDSTYYFKFKSKNIFDFLEGTAKIFH